MTVLPRRSAPRGGARGTKPEGSQADVVLVSMPFGELFSPSMGLSLLKGALNRDGISSVIRYFGLPFARRIGRSLYFDLSSDDRVSARQLAGEWLFAGALFDRTAEDDERYFDSILRCRSGWVIDDVAPLHPATIRRLADNRRHVEPFLDECAGQILALRPRLVGFTTVFQQHVASLALARRLKARAPEITIVFGGSNCEGVMGAETVRQFPFVDAAVSGEGDLIFPEIVQRVFKGTSLTGLDGVKTRDTVKREFLFGSFDNAPPVRDMDALPYPDFDDFFAEFNATGFKGTWQPRLFFETSRGCWWGEKKHCTFCGLNGQTMEFRSKSGARALEELTFIVGRHPGCEIQVVDNILDMRYFHEFLPALAASDLEVELFYETKANLKKEQVRALRDAGVTSIQPGIESFSDAVLTLMRKGVTALQNIQLLKWCTELGVRPYWNVLWGFPGEPPDDYQRMADMVPLLTHLVPPIGFGGLRLDRFSPNFFDAGKLGFTNVRPLPSYQHVYPLPPPAVANLAYHFAFDYLREQRVQEYIGPLLKELRAWKSLGGESSLFHAPMGATLVICDTRPAARAAVTVLSDLDRLLYLQCDAVADVRRLAEIACSEGYEATEESIAERLAPICANGLMLRDGRRYLALAVGLGAYQPTRTARRALRKTLARGPADAQAVQELLVSVSRRPRSYTERRV
ncbi:MAG TPA: RiPP maturation radical SAM C-methyltransferase [Vicinamibacterales bacterium]|nr:RiPP maturation radical SAM C-methyltransferase [Vicinamibacterales bacterium]